MFTAARRVNTQRIIWCRAWLMVTLLDTLSIDKNMKQPFKTIGLIGKYGDPSVSETLRLIYGDLINRDLTVVLDESSARFTHDNSPQQVSLDKIGRQCDLAIIVGGDGTLLHAARTLNHYDIPMMGINLGRLGFLVDICADDMHKQLTDILSGGYQVDCRLLLHVEVLRDDQSILSSDALNDIVLHKWEVARMIEFQTRVDGQHVHTQRSDGMIVATPTGSTAYALSGGGPILHPQVAAMLIVPICPHTLSNRPIVIQASSTIEIEITHGGESEGQLTCDGQTHVRLNSGDIVRISASPNSLQLLHPKNYDYFEILRAKLGWAGHH